MIFIGKRDPTSGRCRLYLEDTSGRRKQLFHRRGRGSHSPTGFEWGYGGSGPAELARTIVSIMHVDRDPEPWLYQQFKFRVIAGLPKAGWTLTEAQIREHLDAIIRANVARGI